MLVLKVAVEPVAWHQAHVELPWCLEKGYMYMCCSGGAGARSAGMCTSPGSWGLGPGALGLSAVIQAGDKRCSSSVDPGMTECAGGLGLWAGCRASAVWP